MLLSALNIAMSFWIHETDSSGVYLKPLQSINCCSKFNPLIVLTGFFLLNTNSWSIHTERVQQHEFT